MSPQRNISILFLGSQMEVAGAQKVLLSQARWFHHKGYKVQAVFFYDKQGLAEDWQKANPFSLISLEARKSSSNPVSNLFRTFRSFWRLFRLLRKKILVVITFTPHSNLLGLPIAWIARVPVRIGTHHGFIEGSSSLLAWFHGRLTDSRICSKMVAVSAQVLNYAIDREGASPDHLAVIENGIEPFRSTQNRQAARKKTLDQIGLKDADLLILTVGRLTVQKGHTYLLDAIAALAPHHPYIHFVFAGDGPLRSELESKARNLRISDRVTFLGIRKDVDELLFASDIFVQPSLWEGLSIALLEALMAGLPIIATRVEGVVDVVENGESALLVPPKDPQSLAYSLEILINDSGLRARLATQGQMRVKNRYSIDTMCILYEKLIQTLLPNAS